MKNPSRVVVLVQLITLCGVSVCDSSENSESVSNNVPVLQYWRTFLENSMEIYAPISEDLDNDLCRNHSSWFRDGVLNNKFWALKMFDASSKLPSGFLEGNVIDLGNYDECLGVQDVDSEYGQFSGQHCMVAIGEKSSTTELNILVRKQLEFHVEEFTAQDVEGKDSQHMSRISMTWSVCVPSSCTPRDVELHLRTALRSRLGDVPIRVDDLACNTRATKIQWSFFNLFFILLISILVVVVLSSTLYDIATPNKASRRRLLLTFSLIFHARRLLKVDRGGTDNLSALNGIRVMTMLWVIVFHHSVFAGGNISINPHSVKQAKLWTGLSSFIPVNGTLGVDTFLLLSGLLVTYNYLRDRANGKTFNLLHYYAHRYIRLTPIYAVHLIFINLGTVKGLYEAPYWGPNVLITRNNCNPWWYSLLYVHNFLPCDDMCLGHTWSLSLDMQLYWLSPLILFPLWKWPGVGKSIVACLSLIGVIAQYLIAYSNVPEKLNSIIDHGELGNKLYYPTYARFVPWLIGVAVGYALHVTKNTSPRLSRATVVLSWALSVSLMLLALLPMYYFLQPDHQFDRVTTALYLGLMRPTWALGEAWCVFALVRGYGGAFSWFFSRPLFQVVSRLSYSIYLLHIEIFFTFMLITKVPQHMSVLMLVSQFVMVMIVVIFLAVVSYLVIESPSAHLESLVMKKKTKNE